MKKHHEIKNVRFEVTKIKVNVRHRAKMRLGNEMR